MRYLLAITLSYGCSHSMTQLPAQSFDPSPPDGARLVGAMPTNADRASLSALVSPLETNDTEINRGEELFSIYCKPCHGVGGAGNGTMAPYMPAPPLNSGWLNVRSDGELFATISLGGVIMPPMSEGLPHLERWQVIAYLRTLGEQVVEPSP